MVALAKLKKILANLSNLPRALFLIWAAGKVWTIAQLFLLVVRGVLPAALVYLTKFFVDALIRAIGEPQNQENIYAVVWIGLLFGGITLAIEIIGSFNQMIYTAHAEKLQDYIFALIHEKSVNADLAFYEQPEFFDHLHRAQIEARQRPVELISQLGGLLQNAVTLLAMGAVLLRFGVWLPAVLLVSTLPAFFAVLYSTLRLYEWRRRKTADERRLWYYDWLLTSGEAAAEIRLFGLGDYFRQKFVELKERLRKERLKITVNQRLSEFLANLVALAMTALAFAWIVWRAIRGFGTLGDLALFYQAFNQGQSLMRALLQDTGKLYANSLFLRDLFEYLALEPKITSPAQSVPMPKTFLRGITFENISFRYQTSERYILKDFNLFIPANKFVAIVGANGEGKSTLLKLLCRFYDPESGSVKFDDRDIRDFSLAELRRMMTVLFQIPVQYNATVKENIALGNIGQNASLEEIEIAATAAGANLTVNKFTARYEQMLGNWFEQGTELSVGEWQRIALARAFLRQSYLILLDEPTSAMDPWAEAEWLERFLSSIKGRTALIITHRFTTAMRADLIYVMKAGKIVESGSHKELVSNNGRYAESWRKQVNTLEQND